MLRCNISKIKWYDWQTERGKVKDEWKYSDGHWGTVCDDQWDINNFFISDVICKMPNYSPPQFQLFHTTGHITNDPLNNELESC